MKKRLLILMCLLVLLILKMDIISAFAFDISLSINKTNFRENEYLEVDMYIDNNDSDIFKMETLLNYDSTNFEYVSNQIYNVNDVEVDSSIPNKIKAVFKDFNILKNTQSKVKLITYKFRVKPISNTNNTVIKSEIISALDNGDNPLTPILKNNEINITLTKISSNNNLKNISIDNKILDNFDSNKTNYTFITDKSSVEINALKDSSTAQVLNLGVKHLVYGINKIILEVVAENKSVKKYEIDINRVDNRSSNNNLSNLIVENTNIHFNKSDYYETTVKNNITTINIKAALEDNKASIDGLGIKNLKDGRNEFVVTTKSETGLVKIYKIVINKEINRDKTPIKSNNNYLQSLSMEDAIINFNKNTLLYNIKILGSKNTIKINYIKEDNKSKVTIIGYDNLKIGRNEIIVRVEAEDSSIREYKIIAIKEESIISTNNKNSIINLIKNHTSNEVLIDIKKKEKPIKLDKDIVSLLKSNKNYLTFKTSEFTITINGNNI